MRKRKVPDYRIGVWAPITTTENRGTPMALPEEVIHPGDVVQDAEGLIYLIVEKFAWGYGSAARWKDRGQVQERYVRLKHDQIVLVGQARLMPEEVLQRRRDSLAGQAEIERSADAS